MSSCHFVLYNIAYCKISKKQIKKLILDKTGLGINVEMCAENTAICLQCVSKLQKVIVEACTGALAGTKDMQWLSDSASPAQFCIFRFDFTSLSLNCWTVQDAIMPTNM